MIFGQITGRKSLRDIESTLAVQHKSLYHVGLHQTSQATLARVNENQPYELYKRLFSKLLQRCTAKAPGHKFKFDGKVYLLDATMIELCLSVFEWAQYRKAKGAMKLHYVLDTDGYLPVFMGVTNGKRAEG